MSVTLDPSLHAWMTGGRTRAVMAALTEADGEARFVGGAVRNALLGVPVTDVDIATPLVPEEVMRRVQNAGLAAVPTGIEHGTVTVTVEKTPYEVTTLRRDVSTDGRRAVVAFTTDWKEDAGRRDFTMNALYADESGAVFDYFGGIADLRARKVRFVGDPKNRIREDYLRILRLFRFHAWYGSGEIDAEAIAAAASEKFGLKSLSGERVQKELLRLLEAKNPVPAIQTMEREAILQEIIAAPMVGVLQSLVAIQHERDFPPDPLLRLASLMPDDAAAADLAKRLRLSTADAQRAVAAVRHEASLAPSFGAQRVRAYIHGLGEQGFRDALMLRSAKEPARMNEWEPLELLSRHWRPPQFPISGEDVKAMGISQGPRVGALLNRLEQEWIATDFKPDRDNLLARLADLAKQN